MENRALRFRIKGWAAVSFVMLSISLIIIYQGGIYVDVDEQQLGIGQVLWLPGLIGSCSCLWLFLTASRARTNVSLAISLITLAAAEMCALVLPVQEISGLNWEGGNGLIPAISFASLALTTLFWTATGVVDPVRQMWWVYGVAVAATVLIGAILSYQYFWFLHGAMASSLAAALVWGSVYDRRLQKFVKGERGRGAPAAVFIATFLALPMLLIGLPYVLQ